MQIYEKSTANFPRNGTDRYFLVSGEKKFSGYMDKALNWITDIQLLDPQSWKLFVEQFRLMPDGLDRGWRGEYWGKMMRAACFVYSYSKNPVLYNILKDSVLDMLTAQDEDGRISTYAQDKEFTGWDLWSRKYVLLGMQYFIEISEDEALNQRLIDSMSRQVHYLIDRIGSPKEGKKLITKLCGYWHGVNSSSILEPIVRLYNLTGDQSILDFATYIVNCGFSDIANFWDIALQNEMAIHEYPISKAYEITSCFMGLLEYYRVTKEEKYLQAVLNFADRILTEEFTVVGSSGCSHELFDHSTVRQSAPVGKDPRAQETCVTVTLMQFFNQLHLITGKSHYIDALEKALYNGYMGALNTGNAIDNSPFSQRLNFKLVPLPFDSYSPLTAGIRGNGIGGFKELQDGKFYSCCVCIGAAGIGVAMKSSVVVAENTLVLNLFEQGAIEQTLPSGATVKLDIATGYPVDGTVNIKVSTDSTEPVTLKIRNPGWSEHTKLWVNDQPQEVTPEYLSVHRVWQSGDTVKVSFDMQAKAIHHIPYGRQLIMTKTCSIDYIVAVVDHEHPEAKNHIAIQRGPLMLARENRLGRPVDIPVSVKISAEDKVNVRVLETGAAPYPCMFAGQVETEDGDFFTVTDYASAGKTWTDESKMAVWMKVK